MVLVALTSALLSDSVWPLVTKRNLFFSHQLKTISTVFLIYYQHKFKLEHQNTVPDLCTSGYPVIYNALFNYLFQSIKTKTQIFQMKLFGENLGSLEMLSIIEHSDNECECVLQKLKGIHSCQESSPRQDCELKLATPHHMKNFFCLGPSS